MPKNVQTTAQLHSSHMLAKKSSKFSKQGFKQDMNQELPEVQAGLRKDRGTRDQIANIHWIREKATEFQKNIYFCFIDYARAFDFVDHSKLWNIRQEMGIPDPYQPPEKSVCRSRSNSQNQTWNNGLVPNWERSMSNLNTVTCLFNLYAEYIMQNVGVDKAQAGIKIEGRNISNLRYADDTTLNGRKQRGTKEPLDESERGE